jgi:hypothetical protein
MTDPLFRLRLSLLMALASAVVVFAAVAGTTSMPVDGDLLRAVEAHIQARVDRRVRVRLVPRAAQMTLEVRYIPAAERLQTDAAAALQRQIMEQAMIRYPGFVDTVVVRAVRPEEFLAEGPAAETGATARASDLRRRLDASEVREYGDFHWPAEAEMRPWKYVLVHHSAADVGSVEIIDRGHRRRGSEWKGIGYDFVIGNGQGAADGEIRATFRWTNQEEGAHAGVLAYNQEAVGICLVGDFSSPEQLTSEWRRLRREGEPPPAGAPSAEQMESLRFLVLYLLIKLDLPPESVLGHREIKPDICPGGNFPMERFLKDIREELKRLKGGG